eukprot:gene15900-33500_t
MIVLKIDQTEKGPAILLTPEAQALLGVAIGQQVGFQISEDGQLSIGALDVSFEARRAREIVAMTEPLWLDKALLLALYDDVVVASGGAAGLRDEGLLESALARPVNRRLYENIDDLLALAATYCVGIASNHPFVDGNKRMAFIALGQFLEDNGIVLTATDDDAIA